MPGNQHSGEPHSTIGFPTLFGRRRRHVRRYREIAQILLKHGFGQFLDILELAPFVSLPRRLLRDESADTGGTPVRLRLVLEELGPTFVKFGQILSTRPDIVPPAYLHELVKLQDTVPPVQFDAIRACVEAELDAPLETLFSQFEPTPLASASLGQVHAARLPDGQDVVVKVQRPGISATVETDLEILYDLSRLVQERTALGEVYDLVEIADDFAATLRAEMDYRREGRNADRFRSNFAGESVLYVPAVYWEYTTRRVLTLERIEGIRIDAVEQLEAAGIDRHQVAVNAAHIVMREVFDHGFFHADPHPGNFVVMPDATIGAMDFGMVGHIDRALKDSLMRLFIVSVRRDVAGMADELLRMGVAEPRVDRRRLERDLRFLLEKYRDLPLREIRAQELVNDINPVVFRHHLHFPTDLWLLAKTLVMLEGVGLQLDPDFDMLGVAMPFAQRKAAELSSPVAVGGRLMEAASDLVDDLLHLPEQWRRIVQQIEQGQIRVVVAQEPREAELERVDRMVRRLAATLVLAAFILGTALLISQVAAGQRAVLFATLGVFAISGSIAFLIWLLAMLRR